MTPQRGWLGRLRCRRWRRLVWAELDGRLPAARRAAFRNHLAACASCAAALDEATLLDGALAGEALRQPAAEFDRKLFQRIAAVGPLPGRDPLRDADDGDPMTGVDWALLGGMIAFAVLAVAVGLFLILPAAPETAGVEAGSELGITKLLAVAVQAPATAFEEASRGLLRHPLAAPILLAAGLLAITLGWVRIALARSAS